MDEPMYTLTTGCVIVRRDGSPVCVIAKGVMRPKETDDCARLIVALLNAHAAGLVKLPGEG